MRVPEPRDGLSFYERLRSPVLVRRRLHGIERRVFIEPTRSDSVHPCTVDELFAVLRALDEPALDRVHLFVLRQPTRKQELLRPVWGRFVFHALLNGHEGPALMLEAINTRRELVWPRGLDPADARELERLAADGHSIMTTRRSHRITPDPAAARCTQLYRTLLHELGHWVDYCGRSDDWARCSREREAFADRYAEERGAELRAAGIFPLLRREEHLPRASEGLRREWFGL